MLALDPPGVPWPDAEARQPGVPLRHHEVIAEELEPFHQDIVPMRDQHPPRGALRPSVVGFQQPEVARAGVRPDVETVAVVVDLVLVAPFSWQEDPRRRVGIGRIEIADLGGEGLERPDEEVALRPAAPDGAGERRVVLLVDQAVSRRIIAEPVPQDLVRSESVRILPHIEERLAVGRPGDVRGDIRNDVRHVVARRQVAHADGVLPPADRVHGVRQQQPIRADRP